MKTTARSRYALRLMVELARQSVGRTTPIRLADIAEITGISQRYLEQLAIALKNHSLIRGVAGRRGGYLLAREAKNITVGHVLDAVNGPVELAVCVDQPDVCERSKVCECRGIWGLLSRRLNSVLNEFTLADLINPQQSVWQEELEDDGPLLSAVGAGCH